MDFNREEEEPNIALSSFSEKPEGSCHVYRELRSYHSNKGYPCFKTVED